MKAGSSRWVMGEGVHLGYGLDISKLYHLDAIGLY